jgi:glycosyltransferase involved in cell wall biosynthesis
MINRTAVSAVGASLQVESAGSAIGGGSDFAPTEPIGHSTRDPCPPPFSLLIPAWNEESRLSRNLGSLVGTFRSLGAEFEIIVIADGSTDDTERVALQFADEGVSVVRPPIRLGKGRAILLGSTLAKYSIVGYMDADCPVDALTVLHLADLARSKDCVIASRYLPESRIAAAMPLPRTLASRAWRRLVHAVLDLPVSDTQCGLKFFRIAALREVASQVAVAGWAFDASLLYHLGSSGHSLQEVPVIWRNDPDSKLYISRVAPIMFLALLAIRIANSRFRRLVPWKTVSAIASAIELGHRANANIPFFKGDGSTHEPAALADSLHASQLEPSAKPGE